MECACACVTGGRRSESALRGVLPRPLSVHLAADLSHAEEPVQSFPDIPNNETTLLTVSKMCKQEFIQITPAKRQKN